MSDQPPRLLSLLADGRFHSGATLGQTAGCSRAAIWKQIRRLRAMGLDIEASRPAGYRLKAPLDLLQRELILGALPDDCRAALADLEVPFSIASTSDHLMRAAAPRPGHLKACVAEYQTGGRGRRGRQWLSPAGRGLCLSVSWCYDTVPRDLGTLSLAIGVGLADALAIAGVPGVLLKWPNDIVSAAGKLGGILIDVAGESGGPLKVVAGVGLNVHAAPVLDAVAEEGALQAVCLADLAPVTLHRNALAAAVIAALHQVSVTFGRDGIGVSLDRWRDLDYLLGRPVTVRAGQRTISGVAKGIAGTGALLVEGPGGTTAVLAGDVTLRSAA